MMIIRREITEIQQAGGYEQLLYRERRKVIVIIYCQVKLRHGLTYIQK